MRVYNYSEARQNFSSVLNSALTEEVIITRKDGSEFRIVPVKMKEKKSPLDVDGITTKISTKEILDVIREIREA